jgi:molybdopterin synthase sulfur carrier subunit
MTVTVLAFGIAKEIIGSASVAIEVEEQIYIDDLKRLLQSKYERLQGLSYFMIAVNNKYVTTNELLQPNDEIAIIPPVSGG